MTETKLIAPKLVFDCEFAEISRDNNEATLSLSVIFTPDELEKSTVMEGSSFGVFVKVNQSESQYRGQNNG